MAVDNDKIAALVTAFSKDADLIKKAQKVQRTRQKDIEALIRMGVLTDEQVAQVTAILPKPRAKKDDVKDSD